MPKLNIPEASATTWTTKQGQKMLVSEMNDEHLKNAHSMLHGKIIYYCILTKELKRRKLKARPPLVKPVIPVKAILGQWASDMQEIGFNAGDMQDFC